MKLRSGNAYLKSDVEMEDLNNKKSPAQNEVYTFKKPRPQYFPFLPSLIKYITLNPTSYKAWRKFITTCKYFYSKNPVIPVTYRPSRYYHDLSLIYWASKEDKKLLDLRKISFKLWLHGDLKCFPCELYDSKVFRYDLQSLDISFKILSFEQFQKLTSNSEFLASIKMHEGNVINSDGSPVALDKMLKNFSNAEKIYINDTTLCFEPDTVKKMVELLSRKLKNFTLHDLPQSFDMETFANFVKECLRFLLYKVCTVKVNIKIKILISFLEEMSPDLVEMINREELNKIIDFL